MNKIINFKLILKNIFQTIKEDLILEHSLKMKGESEILLIINIKFIYGYKAGQPDEIQIMSREYLNMTPSLSLRTNIAFSYFLITFWRDFLIIDEFSVHKSSLTFSLFYQINTVSGNFND